MAKKVVKITSAKQINVELAAINFQYGASKYVLNVYISENGFKCSVGREKKPGVANLKVSWDELSES